MLVFEEVADREASVFRRWEAPIPEFSILVGGQGQPRVARADPPRPLRLCMTHCGCRTTEPSHGAAEPEEPAKHVCRQAAQSPIEHSKSTC